MSHWTTRQGSPVMVEPSDDTWAVYLEASGMTHLVDYLSGEVLLLLAEGARSDDQLLELAKRVLEDDTITIERLTDAWLRPLEMIGLIEEVL